MKNLTKAGKVAAPQTENTTAPVSGTATRRTSKQKRTASAPVIPRRRLVTFPRLLPPTISRLQSSRAMRSSQASYDILQPKLYWIELAACEKTVLEFDPM